MVKSPKPQRGLGRGLSALMADTAAPDPSALSGTQAGDGVRHIPVEKIRANRDQPRRNFIEEDLADLTASIREKGILQPLIVRRDGDFYEIVAGERRWRAAQRAQIHEIPVLVRDFTEAEVIEVALIENIQRADLNPLEEARGYEQLIERFGHTQEQLSKVIGKSRSHVANLLRLLHLPETVQAMVQNGDLSMGHARALVTAGEPEQLARDVMAKGLSVRELEAALKTSRAPAGPPKAARSPDKDADTRALESDLSAALGMKVTIDHSPDGETGAMRLQYKSLDQLDELCRRLGA